MAFVKRKMLRKPIKSTSSMKLSLPKNKSVPSTDLGDYTFLIYGEPKIGKTTLASQFDDPFFMMFEPGAKALKLKQVSINTWTEFEGYITLLEENPDYCKTVVIDTGQMCYQRCLENTLLELNISDPSDEAYGKAWNYNNQRLQQAHQRIFNLNIGLIVLAHADSKEIQTRSGYKYNQTTVQLATQAMRYYKGIMDVIAYYSYSNKGRQLTIRGNEDVDAGCRVKGRFLYTNSNAIFTIDMGSSEEEAYKNLVLAFNNQLQKGGTIIKKKKKIKLRTR